MKKSVIIIVAVFTALVLWGVVALVRRDNGSEIINLYNQKGVIVEQKSELLRQQLDITNQIKVIDNSILEIDAKLTEAINPKVEKVDTGAISDMETFIQSQAWSSQKQTWLVK